MYSGSCPTSTTLDLNLVLDALTGPLFEPLDSIPLKNVTYKVALLIALTSARRVGDIQALSIDPPFLMTYQDRVVLKPDPSYLPKVATKYHRSQEIFLPSFYDNPLNPEEEKLHMLDVKRAVLSYIERTQSCRQSRALFVSFQGHRKGHGVTKATLSRWIREAIHLAYLSKGKDPPDGVKAHSARAVSSSWAENKDLSIELIYYLIDCYDRDLRDRDPYFERQSNKHLDRRGYERERERDRDRLDSHRDRGEHDRERFDRDRHSREERSSSYRDKETTNRRSGSDKPSYERKPERSSFEAPAPAFGATRRPFSDERPLLPTPVPVPPPEKKPETKNVDDLLKKPGRGNRPDRIVVIMRGLPGSGKTHVAKLIRDKEVEYGGSAPRVLSLDDYFMTEVEKVEKDPESGKKVVKKVMEYEYEPEMEDTYRCGMLKSFKKTLDDGFFPFIILDSIHDRVRHFEQFWSAAKTKGFEVYLAEIAADTQTCAKRNVHGRSLKDLNKMADSWEAAPRHMMRLDIRSLLQDAAIEEVEMEDSEPSADPEQEVKKELEEEESERGYLPKSKWEMDTSEAKLVPFIPWCFTCEEGFT
ncbi:unnamed protein product [Ranitomeya imitator]|uniref:YLP motif-containing protein 1 n=1 Tax=Ranitomeya imitator TaxID=111125 RepID=A0ABN9LSA6_9NEOB|nr:unnamed protein product [Ranitomeya imitator]